MITDISPPSSTAALGGSHSFPALTGMDEVWGLKCCQQGPLLGLSLPSSPSSLMEHLSLSLDHRGELKSEDLVGCHLSSSWRSPFRRRHLYCQYLQKCHVSYLRRPGIPLRCVSLLMSKDQMNFFLFFQSLSFMGCLELVESLYTSDAFCLSLALAALLPGLVLSFWVTWGWRFSCFWTSCPGLAVIECFI